MENQKQNEGLGEVPASLIEARTDSSDIARTPTAEVRLGHSYVDEVIEILRMSSRPLHIRDLAVEIEKKRNKPVSTSSLKASISRALHAENAPESLIRLSPGVYALQEWFTATQSGQSPSSTLSLLRLATAVGINEPTGLTAIGERNPDEILTISRPTEKTAYVWSAPGDAWRGLDAQRFYLQASSEDDARTQLRNAGILEWDKGEICEVGTWQERNTFDS